MGMFGGGSTTYFNTSTMPLYDENTAGLVKQSVVSSSVSNRSMSGTLLENVLNSNAARLGGLYRYGASGKYQWGLPQVLTRNVSIKTVDTVKMVIADEVGEPIKLTYLTFAPSPHPTASSPWTIPATPNLPNYAGRPNATVVFAHGSGMYYIAEYTKDSDPDTHHLWWFNSTDYESSYYPLLSFTNAVSTTSPYFPIIPFRVDGERWDTHPLYKKDIRRACRYLGLNEKDLGEGIQKMSDESEYDGKPNPLEEAYVYLGVPINTTNALGKEYLFRYFERMFRSSRVVESEFLYWLGTTRQSNPNTLPPRNSVAIGDVNFENTLSWSYIKQTTVVGTLKNDLGKSLKSGGYTSLHVEQPLIVFGGAGYFSDSSIYFRRQNSDGTYTQLEVKGLGFSSSVLGKEIYYTAEELFAPEDSTQDGEKVTAPLHKDVFKEMGRIKGHDLLNIAVRMQLNDKFRVKHKTNWFAIIIQIVAIVITVLYPPAGVTLNVWARIGIQIAVAIVMQALSPIITKVLQDVFGEELGTVLAIIAVVVVSSKMTSTLTAAATPATVNAVGAVPTATTVVDTVGITITTAQYVNFALDVAGAFQKTSGMRQIEKYTEIMSSIQEEVSELEKLNDLVGFDNISGIVVASQLQDTNKILGTNLYVQNILGEMHNNDLLIRSTQDYTDAMRYTGRVYSPINSARILA
tara:strand:+ start:98 stop:2161 length:2064 start_codon:yes stop_codon:yes gene_type:complete